MFQYVSLGDTVEFPFASNDTSGSGADGASGVAYVRLSGAASSAAPVDTSSGNVTVAQLTDAGYPAGPWVVQVPATSGNGYAAGNIYWVYCGNTVDSQTPLAVAGGFQIVEDTPVGAGDGWWLVNTTIATLNSQTSVTLTAGSADDNAYTDCFAVITDQTTTTQKAVVRTDAYTGSTKTLTFLDTPDFTIATGDTIDVFAMPMVKSNVTQVNSVTIQGDGTANDKWRPA